ncbi:GreA/GreB family elongation factor [Candidatus Dojkabacteria bacterium]|uniref:GreA/GreB family elongation factor n=1 Tax=Candidatus Dojkabacteria bacterium TaxID=2099670 RepID=A0A955I660_9BACT|nr:GreA/GreB family elongation factor [Candidatus Dojkabacteria bacterium]
MTILLKTEEPIYLTKDKLDSLKKELKKLKLKRKKLNEHWRKAVEEGDDRETDAITVTLKLLEETEHEILKVEHTIFNAEIITKETNDRGKIDVGSQVEIELNKDKQTYTIVYPIEADPEKGKISNESNLGRQLIGKKVGDKFNLQTPTGSKRVTVLSISL